MPLTKAGGGNIFSNSCCDVIFAFDEGERILIVSFLRKSLSRVLGTSPKGIDRDALRFQPQAFKCKCFQLFALLFSSDKGLYA